MARDCSTTRKDPRLQTSQTDSGCYGRRARHRSIVGYHHVHVRLNRARHRQHVPVNQLIQAYNVLAIVHVVT